ncbi:MAG TPA: Ni/Fe-hydrogenase cytochrome b subunit, partial [Acidobacteriota bacterium]
MKFPKVTFWRAVFLLILIAGLYSTAVRFARGLGASTALSDGFPWGLWIGFDILCGVALAAGGFTLSAVVYVFHIERFRPIIRPAILTAFLGYLLVITALMFDLGRPYRIWHALIMWNPHSVMFEVAWCVMLYTFVLALEFSPILFERLHWQKPLKVIHAVTIPLVILGVILSMLHQSSLGSLYLIVPEKLYPLWYSPLLPFFFFMTSVALGCSMTILESYLSFRAFGKRLEMNLLSDIGKVGFVVLALYLVLKFQDLSGRGVLNLALEPTYAGRMFLAEMLLGVIGPMILFAIPKVRNDVFGLFVAALMSILGIIMNRLNVSITGIEAATGVRYLPTWTEASVTVMIVAAGFVLFGLAVKYLPVFPEKEVHESEQKPEMQLL